LEAQDPNRLGLRSRRLDCRFPPITSGWRRTRGEKQALLKIFDGIVEDKRISQIARELNAEWLRTRQGRAWTAKDVFELLPRLVEAGPRVFPTKEWAARRQLLQVS
jgi:hypothetical protein